MKSKTTRHFTITVPFKLVASRTGEPVSDKAIKDFVAGIVRNCRQMTKRNCVNFSGQFVTRPLPGARIEAHGTPEPLTPIPLHVFTHAQIDKRGFEHGHVSWKGPVQVKGIRSPEQLFAFPLGTNLSWRKVSGKNAKGEKGRYSGYRRQVKHSCGLPSQLAISRANFLKNKIDDESAND